MWNLTVFVNQQVTMYEFTTEEEAREARKTIKGYSILSRILYFDDPSLKQVSC